MDSEHSEKISKYLALLDGRSPANEAEAIGGLEALGVDVAALMRRRYACSRRWQDRASSVRHCLRYASSSRDAYELGVTALDDRSKMVRRGACKLLAFAQNREAIESLRGLLDDETVRDEAAVAIEILARLQRL